MTPEQVIQHYGGIAKVARALGINYVSVKDWRDKKGEVPEVRQWQIQALTRGRLTVSKKYLDKVGA